MSFGTALFVARGFAGELARPAGWRRLVTLVGGCADDRLSWPSSATRGASNVLIFVLQLSEPFFLLTHDFLGCSHTPGAAQARGARARPGRESSRSAPASRLTFPSR
jgi:hypothetical protein